MKLLRKINTKFATRFMIVLMLVVGIVGSFSLVDLIQSWLDSGETTHKNVISLVVVYLISFSIFNAIFLTIIFRVTNSSQRFGFQFVFKILIATLFMVVLMPGYLYFQEVYKINATLFALTPVVALIVISLAKFSQRFSDQEIVELKSSLKNIFHKPQGGKP